VRKAAGSGRSGHRPSAECRRCRSSSLDAIIYEDSDLMVLQQAGRDGGARRQRDGFRPHRGAAQRATGLDGAELVHRLDRDTSGCLLVAKRRSALRDLHSQLRQGTTEKRYLALVCGKWNLGTKRIELALDTGERRSGERHVAVRPRQEGGQHVQAGAVLRQPRDA
jgi:23S rRNA pseudouridine955/2504/2580 synthase